MRSVDQLDSESRGATNPAVHPLLAHPIVARRGAGVESMKPEYTCEVLTIRLGPTRFAIQAFNQKIQLDLVFVLSAHRKAR